MSAYGTVTTRSEVEVAADLLFTLLDARLLHPDKLNDALRVSGLTLQDLADAKLRHDNGRARPARRVEAWPNVEPMPVQVAKVLPTTQTVLNDAKVWQAAESELSKLAGFGTSTRDIAVPRPPDPVRDHQRLPSSRSDKGRTTPGGRTEKLERQGEKFCSTCGLWLILADFSAGCATCKSCLRDRRKQRYLSVEKEASIERAALRWYRAHNDPPVSCCVCRLSIDVDEEVVMVGEVRHAGCKQ